jgi:hypothetical protein
MFQLSSAASDFPLGMVALLENERSIGSEKQSAVYLWYLTGAPKAAVSHLGSPKLLTVAALDIAVTISLNGAAQGRLWLHAAPEGGVELMDWYRNLQLEQVAPGEGLPQPSVNIRKNDGRYFRFDINSALQFSQKLDRFRI